MLHLRDNVADYHILRASRDGGEGSNLRSEDRLRPRACSVRHPFGPLDFGLEDGIGEDISPELKKELRQSKDEH